MSASLQQFQKPKLPQAAPASLAAACVRGCFMIAMMCACRTKEMPHDRLVCRRVGEIRLELGCGYDTCVDRGNLSAAVMTSVGSGIVPISSRSDVLRRHSMDGIGGASSDRSASLVRKTGVG